MFIRAALDDEGLLPHLGQEWGWDSDFVPCVGDVISLFLELPDSEPTGNEVITGVVVKRGFYVNDEEWGGVMEVEVTIHTDDTIPEGYFAHSPAWPANKHSERQAAIKDELERISRLRESDE